jgi:hypothetical protein
MTVSPTANGDREDMPTIRVWQGEGGNQLLKILNEAVASMLVHEVSRGSVSSDRGTRRWQCLAQ